MKLIFVYKAEAGIAAGIMDSVHKLVSPATYACDLCAITYGMTRMDPNWKAWLKAQPFETLFFHRPDFRAAYPELHDELPAVFVERDGAVAPLITAAKFKEIDSVDGLIAVIENQTSLLSSDRTTSQS